MIETAVESKTQQEAPSLVLDFSPSLSSNDRTSFLTNVFWSLLTITSQVLFVISLPLWIDSAPGPATFDPYFVLIFSTGWMTILFLLCSIGQSACGYFDMRDVRQFLSRDFVGKYFAAALAAVLHGIFLVVSCNPFHTPAILQVACRQSIIPIVIIVQMFAFGTCPSAANTMCALCISVGLLLCILGSIFSPDTFFIQTRHKSPSQPSVVWSILLILSFLPKALYAVWTDKNSTSFRRTQPVLGSNFAPRTFTTRSKDGYTLVSTLHTPSFSNIPSCLLLFFVCAMQFVLVLSLFWIDFIPRFGNSEIVNFGSFVNILKQNLRWAFGLDSPSKLTSHGGLLFVLTWTVSKFSSLMFMRRVTSKRWFVAVTGLELPICVMFWSYYGKATAGESHHLNKFHFTHSWWYYLTGVLVMVPFVCLYYAMAHDGAAPYVSAFVDKYYSDDPNDYENMRSTLFVSPATRRSNTYHDQASMFLTPLAMEEIFDE